MRLTAQERTGLRAMVEFARHYGEGPTSTSAVARAQNLSQPYLERIVASLRRGGLLTSVRGARGGYSLSRGPDVISVADVFRAVEGLLLPLDCMNAVGAACDRERVCATRNVWQLVAVRLAETLDGTSLADLLTQSTADAVWRDPQ